MTPGRDRKPSLTNKTSKREQAVHHSSGDISLEQKSTKKSLCIPILPPINSETCHWKKLQQNNAFRPIQELKRAKTMPCQTTDRTKDEWQLRQAIMK